MGAKHRDAGRGASHASRTTARSHPPLQDPYHSGEYAEWFVKGMEQNPAAPDHIMASACCKHYAANSMDGTTQNGIRHDRNHFDAHISQQDLVDSYLLPFQSCVEMGRVSGLMCSYNAINGVPSCANAWLLDEVARGDWGFDGYVTSDCDADADVVFSHHYHNDTAPQGVRDVLTAGTDSDCGGFVTSNVQAALDAKLVTEADIDERIAKLFRVRMRLGHFDPDTALSDLGPASICSDYAIALSQDGATQSAALLKNAGGALPLAAGTAGTVAVIGPNANYSQGDAGYYGPGNVCFGKFWNVVDAVEQYATKTVTALGVPSATSDDTSHIVDAVKMATAADTTVLVVGTDLKWAAEGHDARRINFTAAQDALISQVSAAAKRPIIIVLLTATPLDISAQLANPKVGAILHVGQPSVTALGLGSVLFGERSPAGRTVQTFYATAYQDEISIFDFNMRPGLSAFPRPDCALQPQSQCPRGTNPGRTHRFYTGKAVVPFGFGLSYTTWSYSPAPAAARVSLAPVRDMLAATTAAGRTFPSSERVGAAAPLVNYFVNVTNTGKVDADDVVLGFLVPPNAGKDGVPLQTLFGFERVHVKAGQTVSVNLYPSLVDWTHTQLDGTKVAVAGDWTVRFGVEKTLEHGMGYAEAVVSTY